ncbi:Sapep family Mn(2+)-dependent dipeptidase [Culicoidibacter larvae]|uniref:Sapep family Mn(2+)-dependent dipeptidase n=1 Tax=Culicoidibacter larvae TaxID=2579976 RepID=A0A5R8QB93_9FIRM|nr:Sapep family Mn(2+)-dependent dipeptidase [Culicoidibacter larvae]TLG73841.1 Sapep family Mn(2+)-dependent dipeptidase [Culicoidibacter larvae]
MSKSAEFWQDLVEKDREQIIADLQTIVQVPSVYDEAKITKDAPLGEPIRDAFDCMYTLAERDGFKHENFEYCAGEITAGDGDEIAFVGHLDVVPVTPGWSYPQFGGVVDNGRVYGRGSNDNKGGTIAAYAALRIVSRLPEVAGKKLKLILGGDEETSIWRCLDTYFKYRDYPKYAIVPDGEFPMTYAEKGFIIYDVAGTVADDTVLSWQGGERANVVPDQATVRLHVSDSEAVATEYRKFLARRGQQGVAVMHDAQTVELQATGISVHAKVPHEGLNANFILLDFFETAKISSPVIDILQQTVAQDTAGVRLDIACDDEEMGSLTLNTGIVRYADGELYIRLNIRYPKGWDDKLGLEKIGEVFSRLGLNTSLEAFYPLHYSDPKGEFVQTLHQIYKAHTGDETPLKTTGGGTYARRFPGAVCFGPLKPCDEQNAHQIDEFIEIDTLLQATAIYADVYYTLATKED